MKAIQIKAEFKPQFLEACRLAGVSAEELKKARVNGRRYFRVNKNNFSQNDIFRVGVYFAELILQNDYSL
jgi:hypothetical protein